MISRRFPSGPDLPVSDEARRSLDEEAAGHRVVIEALAQHYARRDASALVEVAHVRTAFRELTPARRKPAIFGVVQSAGLVAVGGCISLGTSALTATPRNDAAVIFSLALGALTLLTMVTAHLIADARYGFP